MAVCGLMVPRRAVAAALRNVTNHPAGVPHHVFEEYTQVVETLASLVGRLAHTLLQVVPGDPNSVRPFSTTIEVCLFYSLYSLDQGQIQDFVRSGSFYKAIDK